MFNSTEETEMLRDAAERFVQDGYLSGVNSRSRSAYLEYDNARWRSIVDMGWLDLTDSGRYGGSENTFGLLCTLVEALGAGVVSEPFLSEMALGGGFLTRIKNSSLKDDLLKAWRGGDIHIALAYRTRRSSDFLCDPFTGVKGEKRHDKISLEGIRQGVLDGGTADWFLVTGRIDGLPTVIAIPASAPGLSISRAKTFDGRTVVDLDLRGVAVPLANQLALGATVVRSVEESLICFILLCSAESLGITKTLFECTHSYLTDRRQFGTKLADLQALQHRLVDMYIVIERLQSLVSLAALSVDREGLKKAKNVVMKTRLQTLKVGSFVGKEVVQLHGAIGMTDELIVGHYFKRLTGNELVAGNESEYHVALGDKWPLQVKPVI
jgi:alkylation response protein AidB-like acyl-CoA dehydrogenase